MKNTSATKAAYTCGYKSIFHPKLPHRAENFLVLQKYVNTEQWPSVLEAFNQGRTIALEEKSIADINDAMYEDMH